jgi:hypothetical protein
MKKLYFLLSTVMTLSFCISNGQTYDTTTYYGKMNFTFDKLNKTIITTGLLREYGIDLLNLENYNGQTLHDSNWVNLDDWRALYASLYSEQINNVAALLYLDTVNRLISKFATASNPISFVALYYNYQGLDTNAVSKNLITVSNGQLLDVAGRTQSPYIMHSLFAVATTQQAVFVGSNQLIFRPELFMGNTRKSVSSLQVDPLGNGSYQAASFNTPVSVSYPDTGLYSVNVKITYSDGTINYGHTKLAVYISTGGGFAFNEMHGDHSRGTGPPKFDERSLYYGTKASTLLYKTASKSYLGVAAQGDITIDYSVSNNTGQIRKPLIVVEGFDPQSNSTNYPYNGFTYYGSFLNDINDDENTNTSINLNPGLDDDNGYDMIFLHWKNGTDYIERNAYLLETVISYVDSVKTTYNGVRQQNVIIGLSMGGLVARYALRDMEINGHAHDVRLFISHDSPFWGANVPVGFQSLVQHLAPWKLINAGFNGSLFNFYLQWRDVFPMAVDAVNLFNTPAAKQMLIQRYILTPQTGVLTADNSTHISFMNEINSMGWPVNCKVMTLSNGACNGAVQFANYSQMISIAGSKSLGTYFGGMWRSLVYTFAGIGLGTAIPTLGTIPTNDFSLIFQFPLSIITTKGALVFDFGVWPIPPSGTAQIYRGDVYMKRQLFWGLFNLNTYFLKCHVSSSSSMLPLDNAPGGIYDVSQFGVSLFSINSQLHKQIGNWVNATIPQARFCFVPTVSSLAITNAQANLLTNICSNISCLNAPQIANFYAPQVNQLHISYTADNTAWLLQNQNSSCTNCETICSTYLIISGPAAFCSTATYSLPNLPPGFTVTWSASPTGIVNLAPSGYQVTLTKLTQGSFTLTASINMNGTTLTSINITTIPSVSSISANMSGSCTNGIQSWLVSATPNMANATNWQWTVDNSSSGIYILNPNSPSTFMDVSKGGGVSVTYQDQCGETSLKNGVTIYCPCGQEFVVFPNPANSTVSVSGASNKLVTSSTSYISEITIYDALGNAKIQAMFNRVVTASVNVTNLPTGNYIIEITDGMYKERQKLEIVK